MNTNNPVSKKFRSFVDRLKENCGLSTDKVAELMGMSTMKLRRRGYSTYTGHGGSNTNHTDPSIKNLFKLIRVCVSWYPTLAQEICEWIPGELGGVVIWPTQRRKGNVDTISECINILVGILQYLHQHSGALDGKQKQRLRKVSQLTMEMAA